MKSNEKLVSKLSSDIKKLEKKIEHPILYNVRNSVIYALIKSGIAIDYALPFLLTSIVISSSANFKKDAPFRKDDVIAKAKVQTIDTSSGIHLEYVSYDFSYDTELIEYSTGWTINDQGLYERYVTSYRISKDIDLSDTEKILSMTKEEIENILSVTNIEKICKETLTPEDDIYKEDALIVINHTESEEEFTTRKETTGENVLRSLCYIVLVLGCGNFVRMIERVFVKTYIRDKLKGIEHLFKIINKEDLETLKKILELKKQNLGLLDENINSVEDEERPYILRK